MEQLTTTTFQKQKVGDYYYNWVKSRKRHSFSLSDLQYIENMPFEFNLILAQIQMYYTVYTVYLFYVNMVYKFNTYWHILDL